MFFFHKNKVYAKIKKINYVNIIHLLLTNQ